MKIKQSYEISLILFLFYSIFFFFGGGGGGGGKMIISLTSQEILAWML